jgi:hypothetical protein
MLRFPIDWKPIRAAHVVGNPSIVAAHVVGNSSMLIPWLRRGSWRIHGGCRPSLHAHGLPIPAPQWMLQRGRRVRLAGDVGRGRR